jgi:hypothetical protein
MRKTLMMSSCSLELNGYHAVLNQRRQRISHRSKGYLYSSSNSLERKGQFTGWRMESSRGNSLILVGNPNMPKERLYDQIRCILTPTVLRSEIHAQQCSLRSSILKGGRFFLKVHTFKIRKG